MWATSKVSLSLPLFDIYTRGFLEGCEGSLTEAELDEILNPVQMTEPGISGKELLKKD